MHFHSSNFIFTINIIWKLNSSIWTSLSVVLAGNLKILKIPKYIHPPTFVWGFSVDRPVPDRSLWTWILYHTSRCNEMIKKIQIPRLLLVRVFDSKSSKWKVIDKKIGRHEHLVRSTWIPVVIFRRLFFLNSNN